MTLERKAIRRAATAALAGRTAAGARVKAERALEPWSRSLPAISVYARNERCEDFDTTGPRVRRLRRLRLAAELFVRDQDGKLVEELADDLAEQVETLWDCLVHGPTPFPSIEHLTIHGAASGLEEVELDVDAEGRAIIAGARLTYVVAYLREAPTETQPEQLDWFKRLAISWDFPPADDVVEAEDSIDLDVGTP